MPSHDWLNPRLWLRSACYAGNSLCGALKSERWRKAFMHWLLAPSKAERQATAEKEAQRLQRYIQRHGWWVYFEEECAKAIKQAYQSAARNARLSGVGVPAIDQCLASVRFEAPVDASTAQVPVESRHRQ